MTKTANKMLIIALCVLLAVIASVAAVLPGVGNAFAENDTPAVASSPTFTVTGGRKDAGGNESYKNILDGDTETKYCIDVTLNPGPYITFKSSDMFTVVTGYKLYTGNDTSTHTGRNPKDWTLYGSIDGTNWMAVHTVTGDTTMGTEDKTGYSFSFENSTPYQYYKLAITARHGTSDDDYNLMQLSEIEFTATASTVTEVDTEAELSAVFEAGGKAKLVGDIALTADLTVDKKIVELDLNGYVLSGRKLNVMGAAAASGSILILKDSRPDATHTDATLPVGGVLVTEFHFTRNTSDETWTNKALLYANGGTVTQQLKLDTSSAIVDYFGVTMTTFMNGAYGGKGITLNGGLYYGALEYNTTAESPQPYTTNNKKVEFKSADTVYATQFLKSGDKAVRPTTPTKAGYTFLQWYNGANNSTYDFTSNVTSNLTIKAMWSKEVGTFDDLKTEITNGNSVKLTADITMTAYINILSGKNITLDLNGHVISANGKQIDGTGCGGTQTPGPKTQLTIIDSDPTATHSDSTLPVGGYLNAKINITASSMSSGTVGEFHVHVNGGTIKEIYANSFAGYVIWSGSTPSVIGNISGSTTVRGGLYYKDQGLNMYTDSSVKKVTYKDGDSVYAVLGMNSATPVQKAVEPKDPVKAGYVFDGWYNGDTKYDFSTTVTGNLTLTAHWVEDNTDPVISGVETPGFYCTDQEVTVTDTNLDKVTVNGVEVTLDENGKFTLAISPVSYKMVIVATDKALNSTTLTVYAHSLGGWTAADPNTCDSQGQYAHRYCSGCKIYQYIADLSVTDYDAYVASADHPNLLSCAESEKDTKIKLPDGHVWGDVVQGQAPTCTVGGWMPYRQCTRTSCGKYQVALQTYDTVDADYFDTATSIQVVGFRTTFEDVKVAARGHQFKNLGKNYNDSTCTATGNYLYYSCNRCNDVYEYRINGTAYTCSTSQEDYNQYIVIPKKPHKYGTLLAEVPATCVATGVAKHYECSDCHNLFDENQVQKTASDLTLAVDLDNHKYATSCSKKCINTGCTHERPDSERVHVFDTNGSACIYNNNYAQHAYFCTNENCSDGIMYEDHTMVLVCGQTGTGNAWQHWEECSKTGCVYETAKTNCTIKYENKDATQHVMYCQIGEERHELGTNGAQMLSNHDWTTDYVFDNAKFEEDGSCYHAHKCKLCGVLAETKQECSSKYDSDDNGHWQKCKTCGKVFTTSEAHTYVTVYNAGYHWQECSVCEKRNSDYIEHIFESATSTSCSEEGCGYQRFLKANISINGYAIDAPVGGITASVKTDRTDTDLTLSKYLLYDSNMTRIFFETTNANMTFRPNMPYYAVLSFNCGKVYPANDMKADDFTLPQGYEFGYYDFDIDRTTNDVILDVLVTLPALGGISANVAVSEMEIDLKNLEVGKAFGDIDIAITCKGLPKDKSFIIYDLYGSCIDGTFITDETKISNTAYSIFITLIAPDGFTFYDLTDSDITVKNDLGIVYIAPTPEGKVSKDGKFVQICVVIDALAPEHVCGNDGWDVIESYYDYLSPDITTQHTKMCKICGAVEFVNHVYDDDFDSSCDECKYQRPLKLDEMHFTLTGYQSDALIKDIKVTYSGKYASTDTVTCIDNQIASFIFDTEQSIILSSMPTTANFVPGKAYGLCVFIEIPDAIDIDDCTLDNVYVNNTKVEVIMSDLDNGELYYLLQLPAVTGESTQAKLANVELKASGLVHGASLSGTSFKVNHPGIANFSVTVTENDSTMDESQTFGLGYQYTLNVMYTLNNGYYSTGITADDLKASLYDDVNADSPIKIADLECAFIVCDDIGDKNGNRTILCKYYVQLVVPQDTEGHQDGHVFPTENPKYHTDENKHYVLCGCGAHDEGQAHVYGEDPENFFLCTVCGYERTYSIAKIELEMDLHIGIDAYGIQQGTTLSFDNIPAPFDTKNYISDYPLMIMYSGLYEDEVTNMDDMNDFEPTWMVIANTPYSFAVVIAYNRYSFDISALTAEDYNLNGIGKTAIHPTYLYNVIGSTSTSRILLIFNIPALQAQHIHGGAWIDQVPATCTDAGTKGYYVCTVCGDKFDAQNVKIDDLTINALGHNYDVTYTWNDDNSVCTASGVCRHDSSHTISGTGTISSCITQNKTCLLEELTTYTATFANSAFTTQTKANVKTADALGHNQDGSVAHVDAKCTEAGVVGGTYCTRCNDGKSAAEATINALGHAFGNWIAEVPATIDANGTKGHKDCTRCNKHFDDAGVEIADLVIAKLPSFTVSVDGGNIEGETDGNVVVGENGNVTVVAAEPAEGMKFSGWYDQEGNLVSADANYSFNVSDNVSLVARYEALPAEEAALSGGAIAGIVIGSVFGAIALAAGVFAIIWFVVKKKSSTELVTMVKGIFKK